MALRAIFSGYNAGVNHFNKSQKYRNHENTQKSYLKKYQKLTTNYWHLLKGELFICTCVAKIVFKIQIYLAHQLINCSCVY